MLKKSFPTIPWQYWIKPWQHIDWWLFILVVGISFFGGLMIYSVELRKGLVDWQWHWIMGLLGVGIAMFISRCRYENLMQWHWIIYGITNFSLIAVMIFGYSAKGAQRWINIGGFNLQPSEFAKMGIIITLAALLHERPADKFANIFRALAVTSVPWLLVCIQPDLATSLVFGAIVLGMLYWANANLGWLILMLSPIFAAIFFNLSVPVWIVWTIAMGMIAWFTLPWRRLGAVGALAINLIGGELGHIIWGLLRPYQKARITLFLNPEKDPLGGGYHLIQSRIAIGGGELWGRGFQHGPMTQLDFVPEQHTDFIFSAVGEEFGFIGCILVLLVFWLICLRLMFIAQNAKDNFGSLIAIGFLTMTIFHVVVNVGMTIGLAPVAGIPLPWMSYGRSAMLKNFIGLGIVESIANFSYRQKKY